MVTHHSIKGCFFPNKQEHSEIRSAILAKNRFLKQKLHKNTYHCSHCGFNAKLYHVENAFCCGFKMVLTPSSLSKRYESQSKILVANQNLSHRGHLTISE